MEQFLRMMHELGMPQSDVDFIQCSGATMHKLLLRAEPRNTLFTGSSRVGELLAKDLNGKVKLEDAGFDWKILGPDVPADQKKIDYVAHVCDQDAYASSGQKCSAQSILLVHENWHKTDLLSKMKALASQRRLEDLTVGPTLSVTSEKFSAHLQDCLSIPGSQLLFGGREFMNGDHSVPSCYGAMEPTAVYIPLKSIMSSDRNFNIATEEIFAPFQVVTDFSDGQVSLVVELLEKLEAHLTAAVVSNDIEFQQKILGSSVNGTTYVGLRARTTGAPQNHWFGPAGDPRGAGIGTPEAIKLTWSCHREIISDVGPLSDSWVVPPRT